MDANEVVGYAMYLSVDNLTSGTQQKEFPC